MEERARESMREREMEERDRLWSHDSIMLWISVH